MFAAYGAEMVDAKGNITVKSDATRQVLEWYKRLAKTMPDSVYAYDNASNNKELVSGKAALIMNPPSAYAVAVRDKPEIAKQIVDFLVAEGAQGQVRPSQLLFLGHLELLERTSRRRRACWPISRPAKFRKSWLTASSGFDIPPFESFMDFKVWEEVEPPKYTVYNFPPRRDVIPHLTGYPAPLKIGTQM